METCFDVKDVIDFNVPIKFSAYMYVLDTLY